MYVGPSRTIVMSIYWGPYVGILMGFYVGLYTVTLTRMCRVPYIDSHSSGPLWRSFPAIPMGLCGSP
jgi:uncharacterized membrane protein